MPKVPGLIPGLATYFVSLSKEDKVKKGSCQLLAVLLFLPVRYALEMYKSYLLLTVVYFLYL